AVYLPWRWLVLGRFGGYGGAAYDPAAMATGLAKVIAGVGVPLSWTGVPDAGAMPAWAWLVAAAVPPSLALLLALRRARGTRRGAFTAFAIGIVPVSAFLAAADNPQTLRYYYLPAAALAGIVALAGRWCTA